MKNANFKNKRAVVVGAARSGISAAKLLKYLGAKVLVSDSKDTKEIRKNSRQLKRLGIGVELGGHSRELFRRCDLVVVSPGVLLTAACLNWARAENIPVISEIELASQVCPAAIVAITGTSGKSTTTTLVGHVLNSNSKKAYVCGNIGKPFSQEVAKVKKGDLVVLEISSFQLEACFNFKPKVCVILNFSPNHLNRHKDLDDYLKAKKRIFLNQDKNDFAIFNKNDAIVARLAKEVKSRVKFFASDGKNLDANYAAAVSVGKIFGITKADCLKALENFKGLPHRMEFIDKIKGVSFINDSKATTVVSTAWALNRIYSPVILIAGGQDKGVDFKSIKDLVRRKVKVLILIGEVKDKIKKAYKGIVPIIECENLKKAVYAAFNMGLEADCVLLSPMCASFDMFSDFEQRGNVFREEVKQLKKEQS